MDLLAAIIDMISAATTQPVTPELVLTDFNYLLDNDLIGNDPRSDDVILADEIAADGQQAASGGLTGILSSSRYYQPPVQVFIVDHIDEQGRLVLIPAN